MSAARPLRYRRVGNSTYEVRDAEFGTIVLGTVWRTRTGWSSATPGGRLVVEDYPGSRDVAAGALRRPFGGAR